MISHEKKNLLMLGHKAWGKDLEAAKYKIKLINNPLV